MFNLIQFVFIPFFLDDEDINVAHHKQIFLSSKRFF